jgi:hypothetical protein
MRLRLFAVFRIHRRAVLKGQMQLLEGLAAGLDSCGTVTTEIVWRSLHILDRCFQVVDGLGDARMRGPLLGCRLSMSGYRENRDSEAKSDQKRHEHLLHGWFLLPNGELAGSEPELRRLQRRDDHAVAEFKSVAGRAGRIPLVWVTWRGV